MAETETKDNTNINMDINTGSIDNETLAEAIGKAVADALAKAKTKPAEPEWTGPTDTRWNLKGDTSAIVYANLKYRYQTIASLSGVIAGFTYVVANSTIEFNDKVSNFDNKVRKEIYGALVGIAFALSLCAAMLSSSYLLFIEMAGQKNSKWFVKSFHFENKFLRLFPLLNLPWNLFLGGFICMSVSVIVSIGGLYKTAVFVIVCVSFALMSYIFIFIYWKMRTLVREKHGGKQD